MVLNVTFRRCDKVLCFFGVMDACTVIYLVADFLYQTLIVPVPAYLRGTFPHTFSAFWAVVRQIPVPMLVGLALGSVFFLSLLYSAWGLIRQRPSAYVVSYIQAPFRILMPFPSILPLLWVVRALPRPLALVSLLVLESAKILWLESRRGRPPVVRESGPHSAVDG